MRMYNITHNRIIQQHEISVGRNGVYIPIVYAVAIKFSSRPFIIPQHNRPTPRMPGTGVLSGCETPK